MAIRIEYQVDKSQVETAEKALKNLNETTKDAQKESNQLNKESKTLSSEMGDLAGSFNVAGVSLGGLANGFKKMPGIIGKIITSFKGLKVAIASTGIGLLVIALGALVTAATKTNEGMNIVNKTMAQVSAVFQEIIGRVGLLGRAIIKLFKGEFGVAADLAKESVTGVVDSIKNVVVEAGRIQEAARSFRALNIASELLVATLEKTRSKLEQVRDDATLSFKAREQAAYDLLKVEQTIANENIKIAERALKTLNDEMVLKRELSLEDKELINEAKKAVLNAESEKIAIVANSQREINQLNQDRLEKDLDILIDGLDRQIQINLQKIANENMTFDERQKIIDETTALADKSFERQVSIAEELAGKQIDINELVKESDATVLLQKIRNAELSEIAEGRVLEIVNERKTLEADLAITQTEIEAVELEKQVEAKELAEAEKTELAKKSAEERIVLEQKVADAELAIQMQAIELSRQLFSMILGESKSAAIAGIAFEKVVAIAQVSLNLSKELSALSAAAATSSILTGGASYVPVYAALAAKAKLNAGLNIATILSTGIGEVAGFADGVINLQGGVRGKDSIPSLLMPGESVMTTAETSAFLPTFQAIRKREIAPEILNGIATGQSVYNNVVEVPGVNFNFDDEGFSAYHQGKHARIRKKQARYKF